MRRVPALNRAARYPREGQRFPANTATRNDEALAMVTRGEIADMKTILLLQAAKLAQ